MHILKQSEKVLVPQQQPRWGWGGGDWGQYIQLSFMRTIELSMNGVKVIQTTFERVKHAFLEHTQAFLMQEIVQQKN